MEKTPTAAAAPIEEPKMTREERIDDGREKLTALKEGVKERLGRLFNADRMKEAAYVGVSVGYEAVTTAPEKIGDFAGRAKEAAAGLFAKGREGMIAAKNNALERMEARRAARQERLENSDGRREIRKSFSQVLDMQDDAAQRDEDEDMRAVEEAAALIRTAGEALAAKQAELAEKIRIETELKEKAEAAENESAGAMEAVTRASDDNLDEKRRLFLNAQLKKADSDRMKAQLGLASFDREKAEGQVAQLENDRISARERIVQARADALERRTQAEQRRQRRKEMRGEARTDARDRLAQFVSDAPSRLRKVGQSLGRRAKAFSNGLRRMGAAIGAGIDGFRGELREHTDEESVPTLAERQQAPEDDPFGQPFGAA